MKFLFLHLVFLLFSIASLAYIDYLQSRSKIHTLEKSIARNISIKVFGEGGEEWRIEGRELVSFGKELNLLGVLLVSASGYSIKADSITFLRDKNLGVLRGNVEIRGEAFFVKTDKAVVDFNKNLIYGEEEVMVWKGSNYVEGKGFRAYLKPFRVIINSVRTRHEA
ncbi:MAG: LPS export ABC transporter periplasmic protein LptC [Aquificae bacterium]|nr:LPS export ABC transporter periplasmic protein LptC [Aquificota bacterium]